MSAAAPRAEKLEQHRTNKLTQPAETCVPETQEGRSIVEVSKVTEADSGLIGDHGMTPLMQAARDGLAGTVQALIDRGAGVNAKRSDGFNALALAAFFGHSQVVWLLLENGADLCVTGRSETPPERWADARGFLDIGDALREARVTEQLEVSSLNTAVIDEPARFSRSAEKDEPQQAGIPGSIVEAAVLAEAPDSVATLAMNPEPPPAENTATNSEWTADILPTHKSEHSRQQPVIEQLLSAPKILPEIEDPPRLMAPTFHPGSAFVARITASRKNLVALIVALWLVCCGTAAFLFPQLRKPLGERRPVAVTKTANLESGNPVAESGTNVSGKVETPSAPATATTTAPASRGIEQTSAVTAIDKPDSAATSASRSRTRTRKQRAVSQAVEFKQQTVAEEQPQPAPLTVETSRSRSVPAPPAGSANEVPGSQLPPSSIISGKAKSKLIQWP